MAIVGILCVVAVVLFVLAGIFGAAAEDIGDDMP